MALQPKRPVGSTQVLRFSGAIKLGAFTTAAYPKANGEAPSNIAANTPTGVRFLLADSSNVQDTTARLPADVFDDTQPAGSAPHAPTSQVIPNVTNASDELITDRTWCQNTYVTIEPRNAATAAALLAVDLSNVQFCLDSGASSGLGLNTGLPVLILSITSANAGGPQWVDLSVDVFVEVRHSASR
jgi:hypothetical protein